MICCNCVDEGIDWQPNKCIEQVQLITETAEMFQLYFEGKRFAFVIWGKIYRKEFIDQLDFINIRYTEDTHMILNAFNIARSIKLIPYAGYHYRAQENSAMAKANLVELCKDKLVTAEYLIDSCKEINVDLYNRSCANMVNYLFEFVLAQIKDKTRNSRAFSGDYIFEHYYKTVGRSWFGKKCILLYAYRYVTFVMKKM